MVALAAQETAANRQQEELLLTLSIPQCCLALGHSYRSPAQICSVTEVWVLEGGVETKKTQSSFLGAREACITPSHCLVRPPVKEVPFSLRADAFSLFSDV